MTLTVPPHAIDAYRTLLAQLGLLTSAPPCASSPDTWFENNEPDDSALAAGICITCPVLEACGKYADVADERFGIWAGRDRTRHPGVKRAAA